MKKKALKKYLISCLSSALLVSQTVGLVSTGTVVSATTVTAPESTNVIHAENLIFDGEEDTAIENSNSLQNNLTKLKELSKGTITARYKLSSTAETIVSLFSISKPVDEQSYASAYIKPADGEIGIEFKNGQNSKVAKYKFDDKTDVSNKNWHTVSYAFTGTELSIYFDGEKLDTFNVSGMYSDLSWISGATNITVGGLERKYEGTESFLWALKGTIDTIDVTSDVVTDVTELHKITTDTYSKDKSYIWQAESEDVYCYRIPSLVKTSEGHLVIAADARKMHYNDWGDIKTVVKRSTDLGASWDTTSTTVVDTATQPYYTDKVIGARSDTTSSISIDPALLAADNNVVYMLVDVMPESSGDWYNWGGNDKGYLGGAYNSELGSGYIKVNGKDGKYLKLFAGNKEYYVEKENNEGVVYEIVEKNGDTVTKSNSTTYRVSYGTKDNNYSDYGNLYKLNEQGDRIEAGNIYLTENRKNPAVENGTTQEEANTKKGELTVLVTNYLWLFKSTDGGVNWSAPTDITPQVKEDWMKFIGSGAGVGSEITLANGDKRLIFPIYYTNEHGSGIGMQSSAIIYSDDDGVTWKRSESANDGRSTKGKTVQSRTINTEDVDYQISENQVVQLNNKNLLQFMRITPNKQDDTKNQFVRYAISTDGGEHWSDTFVDTELRDISCQLSVITVDHKGKEYIIFANPTGDGPSKSSSRNRGVLRIGEVKENDITWLTSKVVEDGNFAYSSLVELENGDIGLCYEDQGSISYLKYNIDELIEENAQDANVAINAVKRVDEVTNPTEGSQLLFEVEMNQPVMINGDRKLDMTIGGAPRTVNYVSGSGTNKLRFSYDVVLDDAGKILINGFTSNTTVENQYVWKVSPVNKPFELDEFKLLVYGDLNHVFNGDFEKASHWNNRWPRSYETQVGDKYHGTIIGGYSEDHLVQTVDVEPGAKYKLTANIKVDSAEDVPGLFLVVKYGMNESFKQIEIKDAKNEWKEFTIDFVPEEGKDQVVVGIMKYEKGENEEKCRLATFHIDNVKLVQQEISKVEELWRDEFKGTELDTDVWGYELGRIRGNEQQHYVDSEENVFVENDTLTLKVTDRPADYHYQNPTTKDPRQIIYNSGSVRTVGQKEFLYGRIEMRAKLPEGKGAFPAFWTLGADFSLDGLIDSDQSYAWPTTGEIDIMEMIGGPTTERAAQGEKPADIPKEKDQQSNNRVFGTPHFYWNNTTDPDKDGSYGQNYNNASGGKALFREELANDFHTYGINWTDEKIEWYVDDEIYNVIYFTDLSDEQMKAAKASLSRPQYIQLNLATGGNFAGDAGTNLGKDNTEFVIDWVKWSQDSEQKAAAEKYYQDTATLDRNLDAGTKNITIYDDKTITDNDLIKYVTFNQDKTKNKDYEVRFSIENEFMFINNAINPTTQNGQTKVERVYSSSSDEETVLNNLKPGVYNIHYTAVPKATNDSIYGKITPTTKITRESLKLVVLSKELKGTNGSNLSSVELPAGWTWVNSNEQMSTSKKSYEAIYKTTANGDHARETKLTIPVTVE